MVQPELRAPRGGDAVPHAAAGRVAERAGRVGSQGHGGGPRPVPLFPVQVRRHLPPPRASCRVRGEGPDCRGHRRHARGTPGAHRRRQRRSCVAPLLHRRDRAAVDGVVGTGSERPMASWSRSAGRVAQPHAYPEPGRNRTCCRPSARRDLPQRRRRGRHPASGAGQRLPLLPRLRATGARAQGVAPLGRGSPPRRRCRPRGRNDRRTGHHD